tara:strand:- start:1039 stop:1887 length:849 start_codon:yes stop_codon:yes gene_type:complete
MRRVVFVADIFRKDFLGGGECNDDVLINHLIARGYQVQTKRCVEVNLDDLGQNNFFIIGNFISLSEEFKALLQKEDYIIYEHDHKYVKSRDPSKYRNFLAPPNEIINQAFYQNAIAVVVLSDICKQIMKKTLHIDNIYNIGCSLWSEQKLDFIATLNSQNKNEKFAIIESTNPIKNTFEAVEFCNKNSVQYGLIKYCAERELLTALSYYTGLVFFPKVLETFSRISAEAKMLNCKLLTKPKMLGFASEDIYRLSGNALISEIRKRVDSALKLFTSLIEGPNG